MQLRGLFDIPPQNKIKHEWRVSIPIEDRDWNIGLIVGPSGCGKSSIIEELFPNDIYTSFNWSADNSIVDDFPKEKSIKEIAQILNSVGFSSPPSWLKPYRVLSNGEKFRADIARAIAESTGLCVIDEFTSVVDRTVAKIGSAAIANAIRKRGDKFIAVTCHYDVEDWLQPDWVYIPTKEELNWRRLRRRPEIDLKVIRVHRDAWSLFKQHHYLNTSIHKGARCYMATWGDNPVAFNSVLPMPHPKTKNLWRGHRIVCLPDYQGVGIGTRFIEFMGAMCKAVGLDFRFTASHPVLKNSSNSDSKWRITGRPKVGARSIGRVLTPKKDKKPRQDKLLTRRVISVKYVGPSMSAVEAYKLWNSEPIKI
jgi:ABC-type lipoprotein export system ATPase subunit